jgi:formamidopyrimidine-DNA glycosylase
MPELPEVETYARYFARHALDQPIVRVDVRDERILTDIRKETFAKKLKGRAFTHVRRHGKHLFAQTTPSAKRSKGDAELWLHLHFGMSGDLSYARDSSETPRFARILFHFANGAQLAFEDMRLFGLAELIDSPDDFIAARGLGPDPLDPAFTFKRFESLLEKRRGVIKALLMTQEIVAGMGNLYVDETLYQTSIHPRRTVDQLNANERRAVFTSMRKILRDAIARHARNGELPASFLFHHREEGERCPKCGGTIQRAVVFGRTTYFCAKHQR